MRVTQLWLYPIKSCAGLRVAEAEARPRGFAGDRRWMLTDADGRFLSQREHPAMARIGVAFAEGVDGPLRVTREGFAPLLLRRPAADAPRARVTVWDDALDAPRADAEAEAWFSAVLERPVQCVFLDAAADRPVDPAYARSGERVSFADGFPYLVLGEGSLAELNRRLPEGPRMTARRFRPNLVFSGAPPHAEDAWTELRAGPLRFALVKPCARCVIPTLDPETGASTGPEPLRALAGYRRDPRPGRSGVLFGVNALALDRGRVREGDAVTGSAEGASRESA